MINRVISFKQGHFFLDIFWNISYYFLITWIKNVNIIQIAEVQAQGLAELLLNFLPVLAWCCL